MKKILAIVLVMLLLIFFSLSTTAITKDEYQELKGVAELVKNISLDELSDEAARTITEALSEKYGYKIVDIVSFTKSGDFFVGLEVPDEYMDQNLQWDHLYYACDHLVTKEQILTVMKELYPLLTDELVEKIFNLPTKTNEDYGRWYAKTDRGYVVGTIPLGGGPSHIYIGYTEENDNLHFYYAYTADAIRLNAPYIEYEGKTYYSTSYSYEPAQDVDSYMPLSSFEYNGKTYYNGGNCYYILPETKQGLAKLSQKTNEPGLLCMIEYNGVTYYEYPDGFYASSGYMAERKPGDEKLEEPVLNKYDKFYFYYNGHYYGFPQYSTDPELDEFRLDIKNIPTFEANGMTYVLRYSNDAWDYSTKDGMRLSDAKEFVSPIDGEIYTSNPETIVYDGTTYFDYQGRYILNADFGKEVVIKVKNGKAVSLSCADVEKFPENMNAEYIESQANDPQGKNNNPPTEVVYQVPKGITFADNNNFEAGTTVTAKEVKSGTAFDTAKKALNGVSTKYVVYDFSAVKNGETVQPNGKVKVTMDIPATLSADGLKMFYISDKGEKEEIKITVDKKNKTVTAELEHFSTYVLANVSTSPNTGDNSNTVIWMILCLFSLAGFSILAVYKISKENC